ncbi:MAG: 50S ribosomal protein L30 [Smithellaceae bacterium]|nr:50S ribosomal protein L30 [Smithellaceae bacterium]
MENKLVVTQISSCIGRPEKQRAIIRGLGLGKMHRAVCLKDTPEIRGMVNKVSHLVTVTEVKREI